MPNYISILQEQSGLFEEFKDILINFKKDSSTRKSPEYAQRKIKNLDDIWSRFKVNHENILQCEEEKTGTYFSNNIYDKVKAMYTEHRNALLSLIKETEMNPSGGTEMPKPGKSAVETDFNIQFESINNHPTASSQYQAELKVEELLNEQRSNIRAFERTIRNLDLDKVTEKWQLEDKLKTVTSRWESVDKTYWKLDNMLVSMEAYEDDYNRLENLFEDAKALLNKKIWSQTHQQKLAPKIELPVFSGAYTQWSTFKDLFTETVHLNSFISDAQKMQHLKSKLRGEAERLVQHLNISSENYEACWNILTARYNNKRVIFFHYANMLLNQPIIQQANATLLKRLHDVTLECLNAITNLKIDTKSWDPMILYIVFQKLDSETAQSFIAQLEKPREIPDLKTLRNFIQNKFLALESNIKTVRSTPEKYQIKPQFQTVNNNYNKPYGLGKTSNLQQPQNKPNFTNKMTTPRTFYNALSVTCPKCNGQHGLYNCREFIDMVPQERLLTADRLKVCRNCLFSHYGQNCTSTKTCKQCNGKHNSFLHDAINAKSTTNNNVGQRVNSHVLHDHDSEVLLPTAQLQVTCSDGNLITLRALLDQGSQVSLITENAVQRLRLKREKLDAVVSGIGASTSNKCKGAVRLTCQAIINDYKFTTEALIMNNLTNKLPNKTINIEMFEHLQHIQLADPDFNKTNNIDILLGADVYSDILMEGLIKKHDSTIIAQQTHLGWIVCGKYKSFNCHVTLIDLDNITKFWEQEEIQETEQPTGDNYCDEYYTRTTVRLEDGKYQVRLPLKPEIQEQLGTSKPQAIAQLKQLERRMQKDPKFADAYTDFINEYLELGHMVKSNNKNNNNNLEYFMPHHGVIRAEAVTTKLRVVFNASQKTNTKQSLNDLMEAGPNLQADLQKILIQWRQHRYVLTADIEKMYRYIAVHPDDQPLQKIVWRSSPNQPIKEFQLCTVTYGTKAAPYLALKTLKQLAIDEGDKYPKAKPILQNFFFMDDVCMSSETIEEGKETRDQLIQLLKLATFNLRKWDSNEPKLIEDLPENMRKPHINNDMTPSKILGVGWNPQTDEFIVTPALKQKKTAKNTKRMVLSEMSTIFDPLGWLSPITIKMKLIFQQIWLSNISWDDEIPTELQKEWAKLRQELTSTKPFAIKRWLGIEKENKDFRLHAFCDASEKAYACVVYCTTQDKEGGTHVSLIAAKTKVAPVKQQQTLPRLELCGALLLARFVNKIKTSLNKQNINVTAWTDSMVVLGWLSGDVTRWKAFVANRVRQILDVIPAEQWQHVKSEQNSADCASRGLLPSQLIDFTLWWEGPQWLRNKDQAPETKQTNKETFSTEFERKVHTSTVQNKETNIIDLILNKHSNITMAANIIAWVSRFITNARGPRAARQTKQLSLAESHNAYARIIKHTQQEHFSQEIKDIKTKGCVSKNSTIIKFNPKLDNNGNLCVNGRLEESYLSESAKHPIIIPKSSRLTQLLIDHAHKTTLHGGARLTLATLRQQYWIVGGNHTIKTELRKCVRCCRHKAKPQQQLMAGLPKPRITPSKPFHHTGVDFTGSVEVKINKGRGVKTSKGYIAVFVCLVTKAIHLELVSDLSSQTFIQALKRMAARRGVPKHIYCDNGTNFVGAQRELHKQLKAALTIDNEQLYRELRNMGTEFHFNAPSWPSAGGLWESAVRTMKHHLKRVVGEQKLTYEEFQTFLTQIEACLNSRPLGPLTEDVDDLDFLTPGHFLIGQLLNAIPHENLHDVYIGPRNRWQLVEKMQQDFWRKWSAEYLHQLQPRSKWNKQTDNMQIGEVVLIKEDNLPPMKWALGRIYETHPGKDDLVRVVTLKTKGGYIKRPIVKLVKLPTNEQQQQNSETETKQTQKRRNLPQPPKLASHFVYLCVALLALFQPTLGAGNITNSIVKTFSLDENKPVYFDEIGKLQSIHDNWKIITYYNMTTYWLGVAKIESMIEHVEARCEKFEYRTICDSIVTELKHEVNELKHNNYLLTSHHGWTNKRFRRGLVDGVGYLANSLFGVLDERFAQKYRQDIELVHLNNHHLLNLIKNQTSVLEAHNNILKRNELALSKQFNLIQTHLNITDKYIKELNTEIEEEQNMIYFNMVAMSANIVMTKLRNIQETLLNTATNIHHGHVDTRLLDQDQLLNELNIISGQLPKYLSLPVENIREQLEDIYKILQAKSRVLDNFFIIEISLPLTNDNQFSLYRTISIPMQHYNNTVTARTASEYLAVNLRKEIYMSLTESDKNKCKEIGNRNILCTLPNPTLNMRSNRVPCEINIITNNTINCEFIADKCTDRWVGLHAPNTWLYYCCEECHIRVICQEHIISRIIKSAGIITVKQGCVIKHNEATFYTQLFYQNNINMAMNLEWVNDEIPEINKITHKIMPSSVTINTAPRLRSELLNSLDNDIKQIREQSDLQADLTPNDIHQFVVSYFTLGVLAVVLIAAGCMCIHYKRREQAQNTRQTYPPPKPRRTMIRPVEIEMTSFPTEEAPQRNRQEPTYATPFRTEHPRFEL